MFASVEEFLEEFRRANVYSKGLMIKLLKSKRTEADLTKRERKSLTKVYRTELVKRSALMKIAAAWVITVPASGLMAAILFFTIRGIMLP